MRAYDKPVKPQAYFLFQFKRFCTFFYFPWLNFFHAIQYFVFFSDQKDFNINKLSRYKRRTVSPQKNDGILGKETPKCKTKLGYIHSKWQGASSLECLVCEEQDPRTSEKSEYLKEFKGLGSNDFNR